MRWFEILRLRFRRWTLQGDIAHAEGLLRDHRRRLENCKSELSTVERRLNVARLQSSNLLTEALKRSNA